MVDAEPAGQLPVRARAVLRRRAGNGRAGRALGRIPHQVRHARRLGSSAQAGRYWVTCRYGDTTASVTRRLDDDVDFCVADYDGRFMTLVVKHWACGDRKQLAVKSTRGSKTQGKSGATHGEE